MYSRHQRAVLPQRHVFTPGAERSPATRPRQTKSAKQHLSLAALHVAGGRLANAITTLQAAVRLSPNDAGVHYDLGLTCLKANRLPEAIASLRRATHLQANFGLAHYNLGIALNRDGRSDEAIEAMRAAVKLKTKVREAHGALGDLLYSRNDFAEAAECYSRAADASIAGRLNAAKALAARNNHEAAAAALQRMLARDPNHFSALWTLGDILMFLGRFKEALRHLEKACALAPDAVGPFYDLIASKRVTDADRPLIARMTTVLECGRLDRAARITAHYALGKAFDDLKDYGAAIQHFDAANRLEEGLSIPHDRGQATAWVDQQIARYTLDFFREHAGLGASDETPLFVLGMPRSGTTLVEQILSNHPRVAAGDEMTFWLKRGMDWERRLADRLTSRAIGELAEAYRAELRQIAPDASRVTNKMPQNFLWIGLIHLVFPRARIIHCRRHPVDTCLSIYFAHFRRPMPFANQRKDLVFGYRQYLQLMEHWRTVLPSDRFIDVDYEALVANAAAEARRLVEFCGLDWDDACLRPEDNQRVVTTASMWQARQPVYRSSVDRWRCYEPWLGELRDLLPPEDDSAREQAVAAGRPGEEPTSAACQ
jgi:tetratricopeptide (TPR) repeat protein